jgi:cytochrome P450 family 9
MYFIRDPELIKRIGIKDFDYFTDHRMIFDAKVDPMFANSLIALRGQKWREMRASLSPAFTGSKMRQMFQSVLECGENMAKTLLSQVATTNGQTYDMKDLFTRFTNDVIATTAFGIEVNSFKDKDNVFYMMGTRVVNFSSAATAIKFIGYSIAPGLMKALNIHLLDHKASTYFQKTIADNFQIRETNNIIRHDLIQLLLQLRTGNAIERGDDSKQIDGFATVEESEIGQKTVQQNWNDDELMAQCFLFFLAGFDTASTLLSFVAYELAVNTDVQEKLLSEIFLVNKVNKCLTYDTLQKMKYLDMVVCEALRKWPPAPVVDRLCGKDYKLELNDGRPDILLKEGQFCWIPIYSIHHDPKYYPNPEKFDPERFNDENKKTIVSGAYLPFGIGPRNCIGSRFALMEVKAVLYNLLLNFSFEVSEKTQFPLVLAKEMTGLAAENGIHLELRPRK